MRLKELIHHKSVMDVHISISDNFPYSLTCSLSPAYVSLQSRNTCSMIFISQFMPTGTGFPVSLTEDFPQFLLRSAAKAYINQWGRIWDTLYFFWMSLWEWHLCWRVEFYVGLANYGLKYFLQAHIPLLPVCLLWAMVKGVEGTHWEESGRRWEGGGGLRKKKMEVGLRGAVWRWQ